MEPPGNWFRIGTEEAWIVTIDIITWTRGVELFCLWYEFPRVRHRLAVCFQPVDFVASEIQRKKYPRIFWTALTKRAFLLVDDFTQMDFLLFVDPSSKYLTDVSGLDRALRLSWPSRHGDRRNRRQVVWNSKKWDLLGSSASIAKRQNDEMMRQKTCSKRLICRQDHQSGTILIQKRLFFCFTQEFRRLVISMCLSRKKT